MSPHLATRRTCHRVMACSASFVDDPSVALEQFKEVAFKTRSKARQAVLVCTPTSRGAKLLNACTAIRAKRSGSALLLRSVVEHKPLLLVALMPNPVIASI